MILVPVLNAAQQLHPFDIYRRYALNGFRNGIEQLLVRIWQCILEAIQKGRISRIRVENVTIFLLADNS